MIHKLLKNKKVVLASQSPRRKEVLKMLGVNALQVPSTVEEDLTLSNPSQLAMNNAKLKVMDITNKMDRECVVVGADTIVYANHEILGKPKSIYDGKEQLRKLSNSFHYVYTGLSVSYRGENITKFLRTKVIFCELSETEIDDYFMTKEPLDKAGSYGIQGFGSQFVKKIVGDYFNVMGFPISLFYEILKDLGVE